MENVSVLRKKGGQFCTQKVNVFIEIGVFFSLKIREKGSFLKSGNADNYVLPFLVKCGHRELHQHFIM